MSNGLSISPLKNANGTRTESMSLREIVNNVDAQKDLSDFLCQNRNKVPPRSGEPKYERHPVSVYQAELIDTAKQLTASRYSEEALLQRVALAIHLNTKLPKARMPQRYRSLLVTPNKTRSKVQHSQYPWVSLSCRPPTTRIQNGPGLHLLQYQPARAPLRISMSVALVQPAC